VSPPLCGSTEHPVPAHGGDEQLEAAQRELAAKAAPIAADERDEASRTAGVAEKQLLELQEKQKQLSELARQIIPP